MVTEQMASGAGGVDVASGRYALSPWSASLRQVVRHEASSYAERAILVAESFRQTEGEPWRELRWAKATRHLLAHSPVRIRVGERLVGWHPNSHPDAQTQAAINEANTVFRGCRDPTASLAELDRAICDAGLEVVPV